MIHSSGFLNSFCVWDFFFNDRRFKVAVRANPEFLSASIHDLHFLIGCGLLALVAFQDALYRSRTPLLLNVSGYCLPAALVTPQAILH
jgi:hypothetical protein